MEKREDSIIRGMYIGLMEDLEIFWSEDGQRQEKIEKIKRKYLSSPPKIPIYYITDLVLDISGERKNRNFVIEIGKIYKRQLAGERR